MNLSLINGSIGQIQGPFTANDAIQFNNLQIKLGISISEKDLMIYNNSNTNGFIFRIKINANEIHDIKIGREGIYELDDVISIESISFPNGAPESVLVEYVIMDE